VKGASLADALDVRSVSLKYPDSQRLVLQGVSFGVGLNEIVCILGPSGCGKSTLLHAINGLGHSREAILVEGTISFGESHSQSVLLEQQAALLPWKTAIENVEIALLRRKLSRAEQTRIAQEWLARVGLSKAESMYPYQLSGGMQQRVALARLFAFEASIFLLDEAFSSLDLANRLTLHSIFLNLARELEAAAVLVTHDVDEALLLADKIVVLAGSPSTTRLNISVPGEPLHRSLADLSAPTFGEIRTQILEYVATLQ
jgi:NitT/TauT family transport system ATP-binding protein